MRVLSQKPRNCRLTPSGRGVGGKILWGLALSTFSRPLILMSANALPIDFGAEAPDNRNELATEVAAVGGAVPRAVLLGSADDIRLAHWYAGEVCIAGPMLTLAEV